jgi:methylglutaconyl-CoA hydratase
MTDESTSVLLEDVDSDGICVLTMNRPDAMNSLDGKLVSELWHRFYQLDGRDDVRVIILTGAGDRAFCVGADLKERKGMSPTEVEQRLRDYRGTFRAMENVNKPVICAINGYALGGGLEVALACDLRIMAHEAVVGLTETRLGIIPGAGGTQRLPRVVGLAKAKELVFTAARLPASEALAIGLVNRVAPREGLLEAAKDLAREISMAAPLALAQAKIAMSRGIEVDLETGLELEAQCYATTIKSEDRLEGLAAFAEKRPPQWKGR